MNIREFATLQMKAQKSATKSFAPGTRVMAVNTPPQGIPLGATGKVVREDHGQIVVVFDLQPNAERGNLDKKDFVVSD